jgi:hypothetical protein
MCEDMEDRGNQEESSEFLKFDIREDCDAEDIQHTLTH